MSRQDDRTGAGWLVLAAVVAGVIALLVGVGSCGGSSTDALAARGPRPDPAPAARLHKPALWLCIHRHERSSWQDPNDPYFGGLQLGRWFQRTYASSRSSRHVSRLYDVKGTADHWTPHEQMFVADRAFRREGYSIRWLRGQWPTSYGCPL